MSMCVRLRGIRLEVDRASTPGRGGSLAGLEPRRQSSRQGYLLSILRSQIIVANTAKKGFRGSLAGPMLSIHANAKCEPSRVWGISCSSPL